MIDGCWRSVCGHSSVYGLCALIIAQPTALGNLDKASIADDELMFKVRLSWHIASIPCTTLKYEGTKLKSA
jgi:hypothetical protein